MAEKKSEGSEKPVGKDVRTWDILVYPHLTEKSMNMVELENKLVFIVNKKAKKDEIKEAVEKEFDVKVEWVRTEITTRGQKKAFIKISPNFSAADIASKLGMI
jgi:large subunit ribosomal protein L23